MFRGVVIIPLPRALMALAGRIAYRRTPLTTVSSTVSHRHVFFSFYFVQKMRALKTLSGELKLPERAMVVVFPFTQHSWSNRGAAEPGYVYDLTPAHAPHIVEG